MDTGSTNFAIAAAPFLSADIYFNQSVYVINIVHYPCLKNMQSLSVSLVNYVLTNISGAYGLFGSSLSFCRSSTFDTQHQEVSVLYTQGYWKGELGSDIIEFPSLGIPGIRTSVAAIQTSHNFFLNGSMWQV